MNDSLIKTNKPPIGGLKKGIAANRAAFEQEIKQLDPTTVPNRLGLIFDDSGSMSGDPIEDAHKAVKAFTDNCNMKDTSVAVYPLNAAPKSLICDYDIVNMYVGGIDATGGTPIFAVLRQLIEKEPITRAVLFSDGDPTDGTVLGNEQQTNEDFWYGAKSKTSGLEAIKLYKDKEVPVDTIYIGIDGTKGYREMQEIARLTNGVFIHFKDSSSLSTGLKYLAPKFRALLMNPEIKERIQRGENV